MATTTRIEAWPKREAVSASPPAFGSVALVAGSTMIGRHLGKSRIRTFGIEPRHAGLVAHLVLLVARHHVMAARHGRRRMGSGRVLRRGLGGPSRQASHQDSGRYQCKNVSHDMSSF